MADNLPKVYFDACTIIDMAEYEAIGSVQHSRESQVWVCRQALRAARDGKLKIYTSILSVAECRGVQKDAPVDPKAKAFLEALLLSGKSGVSLVALTMTIAKKARDLSWVHEIGLKGADSIHCASALEMNCDEIWTNDRGITKKHGLNGLGVTPKLPSQSLLLPKDYEQELF